MYLQQRSLSQRPGDLWKGFVSQTVSLLLARNSGTLKTWAAYKSRFITYTRSPSWALNGMFSKLFKGLLMGFTLHICTQQVRWLITEKGESSPSLCSSTASPKGFSQYEVFSWRACIHLQEKAHSGETPLFAVVKSALYSCFSTAMKKKTGSFLFYLFIWEMKWASKRHSSLKIEREGLSSFKTSWAQLMSDFVLQWHLSAFPASSIWTAGLCIVLWTAKDATYRGESSFSHCSQSALRSCLLNNYGGKIPSETPEKKKSLSFCAWVLSPGCLYLIQTANLYSAPS